MSFEVKRSILNVKVYDQSYKMERPTVKQQEIFQDKIGDNKDPKKSLTVMKDFVVELGLPMEVVEDMEFEHFNKLIEYLVGAKKN